MTHVSGLPSTQHPPREGTLKIPVPAPQRTAKLATRSPSTPINAMEQPSHPSANEQKCGWDSLTPAELRVVVLVAEGLTNIRIAQLLWLSRYTVETHLKRVFIKLHLTSRAALAAEAVRRGVSR